MNEGAQRALDVAQARVAVAGPGGEQQQQAGVGAGADLVALVWIEHCEEAWPARFAAAVARDLDLAVDHEQPGALVDLVLLERLPGGQRYEDGSPLALGMENLRLMGLNPDAA